MSESLLDELQCVVKTKNGPISGYVEKKNDKTYYKFTGIPYAQPPVGDLRFRPPVPAKSWTNTIDCTKEAPTPINFNLNNDIIGSEDCLYLDVTSPNIESERPLPVMFWIGSYGFSSLLEDYYEPSLLVDEEVIFLRCNFRLGPFGFLSVNDFMAPGNCGMKDIVLALKWTKDNISAFGGDPNNVTIFGSSSGGSIVHFLMISPMAAGLFHKAIIQSASALNSCSLTKNPIQPAMDLAKELGIKTTCPVDIVEALKATPVMKIMEAIKSIEMARFDITDEAKMDPFFRPCIEQEFEGQPAFLTKSPPLILKSGNFNKVPLIIGSNNIEASVLQFFFKDFYNNFEKYNESPELIVPKSLSADRKVSKQIGQQLLKFYLDGDTVLRQDTKTQYLQLVSDYYFLYYVNKTVQLHSQYAPDCPIYYYILNHAGEWNLPQHLNFFNSVGHGADIPFIFGLKLPGTDTIIRGSRDSVKTRRRVIKMWTNFARYGDPTPDEEDRLLQIKWDPVENKDKLNYLSIGSELTKGRNPFFERMQFWEGLHKEHVLLRVLVYFNDIGIMW